MLYCTIAETLYRCVYLSLFDTGVEVVNTWHVVTRPSATSGDGSAGTVADDLNDALTDKYRAILNTRFTVQSITVTEELAPGSGGVPDQATRTINEPGTWVVGDTDQPLEMVMLASLLTNAAVRGGRGRQFLPGPMFRNSTITGTWAPTLIDSSSFAATYLDELIAQHQYGPLGDPGHIDTVVYSRTRRARSDPNYFFDVTGYIIRPQPHWLRSRSTAP